MLETQSRTSKSMIKIIFDYILDWPTRLFAKNIPEDANHRVVRTLLVEESREEKYENQFLKKSHTYCLINCYIIRMI